MLNKSQKKELVKEIEKKFKKNKLAVFCNFKGLSMEKQRELKKQLKEEAQSDVFVVKRRLLQKALLQQKIDFPEINGSVMVAFSNDEILPAKIIFNFKKEGKKEQLEFIGGVENNQTGYRVLSADELKELATLPSKEEILVSVVNVLKAPMVKLNYALKGNLQKLVYIFANVRE